MFIADESVDMSIVEYMKALFHQDYSPQEIISIQEAYSGIQDTEVLNLAYTKNRILLTEDKDFGELVYRMKYPHCGIVLIRIKDMPREERIRLAALTIKEHHTELKNNFQLLQIQE
jgi:hypothetical protein